MAQIASRGARLFAGPILWAAAIDNVAFGVFVGLFPLAYWEWIGIAPPLCPTLWQYIGMIVACYGVGSAFAARAPSTLWPIGRVGMRGKLLGPAASSGRSARGSFRSNTVGYFSATT